jgi:hypothetical protein
VLTGHVDGQFLQQGIGSADSLEVQVDKMFHELNGSLLLSTEVMKSIGLCLVSAEILEMFALNFGRISQEPILHSIPSLVLD